jgi:hypothetical protein
MEGKSMKFMVKIFSMLVILCFVGTAFAETPSTKKRNVWDAEQQFKHGVRSGEQHKERCYLDEDGSIDIYNTSGTKVFGISNTGKPEQTWKANYLIVDTEAEAEARSTAYNIYFIDQVNFAGHSDSLITGTSFYLPTGCEDIDGLRIRFVDISASGTSDLLIVPANDCISAQGITDFIVDVTGTTGTPGDATEEARSYNVLDAQHEAIEYVYRYAAGGGTWYQVDAK